MRGLALTLLISATVLAIPVASARDYGDVDKVNGGISIENGSTAGRLETVNGGIRIGDDARATSAETVNGGIRIGARSEVGSVETVNGGVRIDRRSVVTGDIDSVNGGVRLAPLAEVRGHVENVNGDVIVDAARIHRGIATVNGDVLLDRGAQVSGGVHVEKSTGWGSLVQWGTRDPQRVVVGRNSVVQGEMRFEREVRLFVHRTARIGRVIGATVERYDTDEPPL